MKSSKPGLLIFRLLLTTVILATAGGASWVIMDAFFKQESRNQQALTFLSLEQQAYQTRDFLRSTLYYQIEPNGELKFSQPIRAIIQKTSKNDWKRIKGRLSQDIISYLDVEQFSHGPNDLGVFLSEGKLLALTRALIPLPTTYSSTRIEPGEYFVIWPIEEELIRMSGKDRKAQVFLMNREGQTLYRDKSLKNDIEAVKKGVVQKYIQSPINRASTYIETETEGNHLAFYMAIPKTNLLLFGKSKLSVFYSPMLGPIGVAGAILMFGVILVFILTHSLFQEIKLQAEKLAEILNDFSQGLFIPPKEKNYKYYRELDTLTDAVYKSTERVRNRLDQVEKQNL